MSWLGLSLHHRLFLSQLSALSDASNLFHLKLSFIWHFVCFEIYFFFLDDDDDDDAYKEAENWLVPPETSPLPYPVFSLPIFTPNARKQSDNWANRYRKVIINIKVI